MECWDASEWEPCRKAEFEVFKVIQKYRQILDINLISKLPENETFMYVMECAQGGRITDGNIWIFSDKTIPGLNKSGNHPCLIDNKPVQAAGVIIKKKNKITIDACSGHYAPNWKSSLTNVNEYLQNKYIIDPNEKAVFKQESDECDEHSPMVIFTLNKAIFNLNGKLLEESEEEEKMPESMVKSKNQLSDEGKVTAVNLTDQTEDEERGPPNITRVMSID